MRFSKEDWHRVQIRCNKVPFDLDKVAGPKVKQYCDLYAKARNTCPAFIYSLSLGLVSGMVPNHVGLDGEGFSSEPLSNFIMAIGIPSCGKSVAFDTIISEPATHVQQRTGEVFTFNDVTKEGLLSALRQHDCMHGALVGDELGLYFDKLVHRQQKDRTGETQIYSTLWSGTPIYSKLSQKRSMYIPRANIAIAGCIQTELALDMLASLPRGDGFKDRLLLVCPKTLKTMAADRKTAKLAIQASELSKPTEVADKVHKLFHREKPSKKGEKKADVILSFTEEADTYLTTLDNEKNQNWNELTDSDQVPEQGKQYQITKRNAALLHIFEYSVDTRPFNHKISIETVKRAEEFINYCTGIFGIFDDAIQEKMMTMLPQLAGPSAASEEEVMKRLMLWKAEPTLPSPRALQQSGPCGRDGIRKIDGKTKSLKHPEILMLLSEMAAKDLGELTGPRKDIFKKKSPEEISEEALQSIGLSRQEYRHHCPAPPAHD